MERPPDARPVAGRVVLLGGGRQAAETAGYCLDEGLEVVAHVEEAVDGSQTDRRGITAEVLAFADPLDALVELAAISAVGAPDVRRRLVERWPGGIWLTLVSRHAWVAADAVVGDGSTIAPHAAVNRLASVGRHVLVNVGAIVSHDVVLEDYVTVSPGCVIGGCATVGRGTFIGLGAVLRDRVHVGRDAFIAAGAVVVEDVNDGSVVKGVPARAATSEPLA